MSDKNIVFLHAFPFNSAMWQEQIRLLPSGWNTFAPDLPGFGNTPVTQPNLDDWASWLLDQMGQRGIKRTFLVGLSMGGYLAFRLLAIAPKRFLGVLLADTRAAADTPEGKLRRTATAAKIREEGIDWMPEAQIPGLLAAQTIANKPSVVDFVRTMILDANPAGVEQALLAMRDRPDSSDVASKLTMPVSVVCGLEDVLSPPREMAELAATIPGASFHEIPGAGHLSCLEEPYHFARILADLLDCNVP